jgi:hypothetical protein
MTHPHAGVRMTAPLTCCPRAHGELIVAVEFSITKAEFEEFDRYFTYKVLKNPDARYGREFLWYFDGAADYLRAYSNLGTPPGVHNPSNDDILYIESNHNRARSMILDLIEIK